MNVNDIITLLNAGYSKEEITAMDAQRTGEPAPAPAQPEQPAGDPAPEPAQPAGDPDIKALLQQNNELLQTIKKLQDDNRQKADSGNAPEANADSVIKDFFGPKKKAR